VRDELVLVLPPPRPVGMYDDVKIIIYGVDTYQTVVALPAGRQ